ncbi:MAG: diacylglycerol kinase family protein [Myxococcota bacterium]
MGEVAVIVNPHARKNRGGDSSSEVLERVLADRGSLYRCGDPDTLADAAQRIADNGTEVVAISGGDGTGSMVLTALRVAFGTKPLPKLALLRGGTMNTVANGVGVPRGKPPELLSGLLEARANGAALGSVARRTLDIGGRVGFLFGLGVIHGFLDEYYRRGRPYPTPLTAVETLSVAIGSAMIGGRTVRRISERFRGSLVVDGETIRDGDFLAIGAGTTPELGLGFRPFQLATPEADGFHLLGITCSAPRLTANLPRLYRGRGMADGDGFDRLARELTIATDEAEIRYMVDGDLDTTASPLRVSLGPTVHIVTSPPA